nr:hypothetical protein [Tanacetum cinerariifolium]
MKDVFEELEAEVAQCVEDRKHEAIDRKNLLIANDNLIAECLSKDVFSIAIKSELNVARFTKMHVANTSVEARCLALEAELATLRDKSHQENQGELIKHFSKLEGKDNAIRQLKKQLSNLQVTSSDTEHTVKVRTTDSQLTKVTDPVTNLQAQNDLLRAENDKVKQQYKEWYDSIKITRAKHIEQVTKLTAKNVTLKTSVNKAKVQPPVLTRTKHVVDVEPIVPCLRNNKDAHLDYLMHLKESVETIHDIVEEAKVVRPLDRSIVSACHYTKHSHELLEKKQVTIAKPSDKQDSNKQVHVVAVKLQKTNVPVPHNTGVTSYPKASGSQPKSNPKTNRILPAKGANKLPVEDLPRMNKSYLRTTNRVDSISRLKRTVINSNLDSIFQTCNKCLTSFDHDMCVAVYVKSVVIPHSTRHNCEVERKMKQVWKPKQVGKVWKPTGKVLTTIGHQWRPTGRILHLGKQCPLTRPDSVLHLANDEPVLGYLKFSAKGTKKEVFGMPIPGRLITADIQEASYYQEYQENVAKHRGFLADAPTSAPAKSQENKYKQATETTDKPAKAKRIKHSISRKTHQPKSSPKSVGALKAEEVLAVEPRVANEEADYQKVVEESLKTAHAVHRGPLPPVVIREPESGKYQPPLEVPGKGKAKVTKEQVAHDLLSLQKAKRKNPVEQYIFQRRIFEPTGSSFHDESPYDVLGQSDSEEESKKVLTEASEGGNDDVQTGPDPDVQNEGQKETDADTLDEGQAGSNPDKRSEGQARPDPSITGNEEQSIPNPVVYAGSNREDMDLDVTKASPQPSTEQLDEGFLATAYPQIQESLKLTVEEQVLLEEPVSSSGTLSSLHHLSKDISFGDQFFSDKPLDVDKNAETEVESMVNVPIQQATSSISISPMTSPIIDLSSRPVSPKQSTAEAMMVKRIGELEHIMDDLIQVNKNIEERLDKHGARLYTLEQLDIPQQVSIAISEVVTDAVDWAMQVPLRNRFRDLPEADMKEILHQRMSPPHQPPPPPPPPTGPSGPSKAPRDSGSQVTPPPPPLPTSTS